MSAAWGLMPDQAVGLIKKREWDNISRLKARLSGEKKFPLKLGLKPPGGRMAVSDMPRYLEWIEAWKNFAYPGMVQWETRNFSKLENQTLPIAIEISSISQLVQLLGRQGAAREKLWEEIMPPILGAAFCSDAPNPLYPVLIQHLELVEKLGAKDAVLLAALLPQLKKGMGQGQYLRALSVKGVDTKFIETHAILIENLLDALYKGELTAREGGLSAWLGCVPRPAGWLMIRPLNQASRNAMGQMSVFKVPYTMLKNYELPATRILVVENVESGLALPFMEEAIAVIGGGKNVAWMDAPWLQKKEVGYWGDIDTWGLSFLSDARSKAAHLTAFMMDEATLRAHEDRMSVEPTSVTTIPEYLTLDETRLFRDLNHGVFISNRLEQERISSDYICNTFKSSGWL